MPRIWMNLKKLISKQEDYVNILYYYGERWPSVHHSRLREVRSKLNNDLCYKLHVPDDPFCSCRFPREDAHHFFFVCISYQNIGLI